MSRLDKADIWDCGTNTPERLVKRTKLPGSTLFVREHIPPGRFEKWVDAKGNVKRVRITTSAAMKRDEKCENNVRAHLRASGAVPYGRCPLRDSDSEIREDSFPEDMRTPCRDRDEDGRKRFGDSVGCCPHVERLIAERQEANRLWCAEVEKQARAAEIREERKVAAAEAQAAQMGAVLGRIADKLDEDSRPAEPDGEPPQARRGKK